MKTFIGIDLGTSALKAILIDSFGNILKQVKIKQDVISLKENYSEQDPNVWYKNLIKALKILVKANNENELISIGFSGQMHGLVMLDKDDNVIRNAILWNDGRSYKEVEYLNNEIGKDILVNETGNIAFSGFTFPKLLWVKNNEYDNFLKINKVMLPKDYLVYKLTGKFVSDVSDLSGTLFFNTKEKKYSKKMLEFVQISDDKLPKILNSYDVVGFVKDEFKKVLKLKNDVKVVIGGGDNAIAAIGNGIVKCGNTNISLGTSGTVFIKCKEYIKLKNNSIHMFCDATGAYSMLGCILSASSARKRFLEDVLSSNDYKKSEERIKSVAKTDVLFLPFLNGERTPYNNSNLKGSFLNLNINSKKEELEKAIMEGVAFALKESFEIAKENGVVIKESSICGGGAKSDIWCQIIADVLNIKIIKEDLDEGPSFGAALISMKGVGEIDNFNEIKTKFIKIKKVYFPNSLNASYYEEKYKKYKGFADFFNKISKERI